MAPGLPSLIGTDLYLLRQHIVATKKAINRTTPSATPTPIPAFAPDERPLEPLAGLVGELVADVDCGFEVLVVFPDALVEVAVGEVCEAEEVVEEAVAATTNLSPNASTPVESMIERKKVLPGVANGPGVQEYEFDIMLTA